MAADTTCHQVPSWGGACQLGREGRQARGRPKPRAGWPGGAAGGGVRPAGRLRGWATEGNIHIKGFWKYRHRGQACSFKKKKERRRRKQVEGGFGDLTVSSTLPYLYPSPCGKPDSLKTGSVVFRDRGWVVLFCSLVYFLVYRNGPLDTREDLWGAPPPVANSMSVMYHCSQTEQLL